MQQDRNSPPAGGGVSSPYLKAGVSTPRLMNRCTDGRCAICSDELLSVLVVEVDEGADLALTGKGELRQEIDISLVEGVSPGDILLVHGGVAIAREGEGRRYAS